MQPGGPAGQGQWGAPPGGKGAYEQQQPYPPNGQWAAPPPQGYAYPPQAHGAAAGGYGAPPPGAYSGYGQPQQQPPQVPPANSSGSQIGAGSYVVNVDGDMAVANAFAETVVRNGFVRKVFGIVALQMAFTVGIACLCLFAKPVNLYVRANPWLLYLAWGVAIALLLVLACVEKARRVYPTNMILLAAFTVAQAFLVGIITAFYSIEAVLLAFLVTGVAVLCLSLFAINTKIDVTRWGTLLLVAGVAFIVLLLVGLFWISKVLYLVIAGIACLLFSAYLIYDIQLVMGGRYYSISPDEYVFAALNIYLDIINLFIWILAIVGLAGGNNS